MAKNKKHVVNKENASQYEKGITKSKLMVFFDWVWRLFILNTFTLLTSLGIITALPSLVACFRTLKECYEEDEQHIVKRYFENFIYCFKDTVGVGILFTCLFTALIYSLFYYTSLLDSLRETGSSESWITFFWFLFFFSIALLFVLLMVYIQLPMVVTYFHFHFFDKIRFAFYMAFKYFAGTLEELCLLVMWSTLCFVVWVYVPVVFCFVVTIPLILNYIISRKYYWFMANSMEYQYEEDEFDIKGEKQVRETYEDKQIKEEKTAEENLEKMNNDISR